MLVIIVTINLHGNGILKGIRSLGIKESSTLVIIAIITVLQKDTSKIISRLSTTNLIVQMIRSTH